MSLNVDQKDIKSRSLDKAEIRLPKVVVGVSRRFSHAVHNES